MASALAEPSSGPPIASFASRQALCGISLSVISAPMNGMKSGADTGSPCRFASRTCPISCTNSNTTSPIPNHQPPIQTYTAADTNIEKRNLNLSRTKPNLARNAPIAAMGAQILRKRPRQSKPFGWIGSYWRHSCGYCSMSAIVPTRIGCTAATQEPRPNHDYETQSDGGGPDTSAGANRPPQLRSFAGPALAEAERARGTLRIGVVLPRVRRGLNLGHVLSRFRVEVIQPAGGTGRVRGAHGTSFVGIATRLRRGGAARWALYFTSERGTDAPAREDASQGRARVCLPLLPLLISPPLGAAA